MKRIILTLLIPILIVGCSNDTTFKNVGDIPFDRQVDDVHFKICNENNIKQYYARNSTDEPGSYKGEKRRLERTILSAYDFPKTKENNDYLGETYYFKAMAHKRLNEYERYHQNLKKAEAYYKAGKYRSDTYT